MATPGRSKRRAWKEEQPTKPLGGPRPSTGAAPPPPPATEPSTDPDAALPDPPGFDGHASSRSPADEVRDEAPPPQEVETPPLTEGLDFGDYRILGEIARGSSGVLYRAVAKHSGETVALRVLQAAEGIDEGWLDRFEADQDRVLGLDHTGIVPLLDVGAHLDSPFVVLPLLEGETLDQIPRGPTRPVRASLHTISTVARALHHAHSKGLIHGGVQPSNIVVDPDLGPRLLDFGLSRALAPDAYLSAEASELVGANGYLSPEQVRGESSSIDARSDVFGLGAVLHELVTGKAPFHSSDVHEMLAKIVNDDPIVPSSVHPEADADLDAIVAKALRKQPEDRYPNAAAFADDVDRYLAGEAIWAERPSRADLAAKRLGRHRRPILVGLALLSMLVLGLTGARLWLEGSSGQSRADLSSPDGEVRAATLRALFQELGANPSPRKSEVLVAITLNSLEDDDERVRLVALHGLTDLVAAVSPGSPMRRALERQLARSLDPGNSDAELSAALHAIAALDARGVGGAVVSLAAHPDTTPPVRDRALTLLGELAFENGFTTLMAAFAEGGDLRETARRALERLTEQLVEEKSLKPPAPDDAEATEQPAVRRRSARSPGQQRATTIAVLERLGDMIDPGASPDPVVEAMEHSSSRTRLAAVWVIVRTSDPRGATLLVDALSDSHPPVGRAAAAGLMHYGGPRLERQLAKILSDPDPHARANAASAIGEIRMRGPSLTQLYRAMHQEQVPFARISMARALGRIGELEAVPHLLRLLDDPSPEMRDTALVALQTLTGESLGADRGAWQSWWDTRPAQAR